MYLCRLLSTYLPSFPSLFLYVPLPSSLNLPPLPPSQTHSRPGACLQVNPSDRPTVDSIVAQLYSTADKLRENLDQSSVSISPSPLSSLSLPYRLPLSLPPLCLPYLSPIPCLSLPSIFPISPLSLASLSPSPLSSLSLPYPLPLPPLCLPYLSPIACLSLSLPSIFPISPLSLASLSPLPLTLYVSHTCVYSLVSLFTD